MRQVLVLLHRGPEHPRTAQGLRAALGYVTANLRVTVVLCGPARRVLALCQERQDAPPALGRPIGMLRALGHQVLSMDEIDLPALLALAGAAHAIVTW